MKHAQSVQPSTMFSVVFSRIPPALRDELRDGECAQRMRNGDALTQLDAAQADLIALRERHEIMVGRLIGLCATDPSSPIAIQVKRIIGVGHK